MNNYDEKLDVAPVTACWDSNTTSDRVGGSATTGEEGSRAADSWELGTAVAESERVVVVRPRGRLHRTRATNPCTH